MHTASFLRCVNSALIELVGLYPPEESFATELPKSLVDDLGVANPPFKIRNAEEISQSIGPSALPYGFQAIPVTSELFLSHNDIQWAGCPTVLRERARQLMKHDLFDNYEYLVD